MAKKIPTMTEGEAALCACVRLDLLVHGFVVLVQV